MSLPAQTILLIHEHQPYKQQKSKYQKTFQSLACVFSSTLSFSKPQNTKDNKNAKKKTAAKMAQSRSFLHTLKNVQKNISKFSRF